MEYYPELNRLIEIACRSDANVLLTGPTGSGKSSLARKVHDRSARAGKPFIIVNLATLHEGTFESELFGHEKGAFTGADQRRIGKLELANGGTVFLDEIGDLSPRLQSRLLDFLQSRTISPVGSNRDIRLDVRVIAATHRDLAQAALSGLFREDLLHRIRVIPMRLRSLSERADDFDAIVHGIVEELCAHYSRSILRLTEEVAQRLEEYSWPGNFRELRNVLEYAVLASEGDEICASDLPSWFVEPARTANGIGADSPLGVAEFRLSLDYQSVLNEFEKEFLKRALQRYRGRISLTARRIGMNKTTLLRRIRSHGLMCSQNEPFPAKNEQFEALRGRI